MLWPWTIKTCHFMATRCWIGVIPVDWPTPFLSSFPLSRPLFLPSLPPSSSFLVPFPRSSPSSSTHSPRMPQAVSHGRAQTPPRERGGRGAGSIHHTRDRAGGPRSLRQPPRRPAHPRALDTPPTGPRNWISLSGPRVLACVGRAAWPTAGCG